MRQPRSIRIHLALVLLLCFLLIGAFGVLCISQLNNFNRRSADVAERWLPTIRVLGDLNNSTSDFRAIEGSNLLAVGSAPGVSTDDMEELDRSIAQAERSFERIPHSPAESQLYAQFKERWNDYRKIVNQMLAIPRNEVHTGSDPKAAAIAIYNTTSRTAYNAASDALGNLTDTAVANARTASQRLASTYRQAVWLILVAISIAGLLAIAALSYVSRFISAPLLRLADRMHKLAVNDTSIDIPDTERGDEIGEMARAAVVFRANAIELMRSQQALAGQASRLREQLAQEQHLSMLQRNFVSMASHEFRTPLNVIDGHAQRLNKMKDGITPREIGERAGKLRAAVSRITHLIDNLLHSARLMDGGAAVQLQLNELDLSDTLKEVVQLHREIVPGSQIIERLSGERLTMVGDQKLLFQLFSNLVSNAIKYSPDGGPITISDRIADQIVVDVADRGIGIPGADLENLFERYHRGSNVSGIVGTGVGLYLVKIVTELHGGTIEVDSEAGKGTRFTVRLPRGPSPVSDPQTSAGRPHEQVSR